MILQEPISLFGFILTIIIVAATTYPFIVNYIKRPKLVLEPHYWGPKQNVKLLGFKVTNRGKNLAKGVYGVIEYSNTSISRIRWNDSENIKIDIDPGPLNECWFYVAKLDKSDESMKRFTGSMGWIGPAKEHYEISVKLYWEYHALRHLMKKFSLTLSTWEESKILPV